MQSTLLQPPARRQWLKLRLQLDGGRPHVQTPDNVKAKLPLNPAQNLRQACPR